MHPSHIWARLYRRNLFDCLRFTSIWYEDMELFPRLLAKADRLYYYKVPVYYYRQHKKGITHQREDKRNLEVITAWHNAYTKADYSGEERKAIEICIKKSISTFFSGRSMRQHMRNFITTFLREKRLFLPKIKMLTL